MTALLPGEFADLEPFAETWCLETEPERYGRRLDSTMEQMQSFYDAVTPRAEAALVYLDRFALDELPDEARRLLWLLYSMVMVSFPVEVWSQQRVPDSGAAMLNCVLEPRI
ncbi:hypothetical protein ACWEKT_22775 [Nocardia takedensis]|uniref:hypothetical protein n=1 Tax=Nocardia takedensis TaxID=259390 RepID=UPI0002F48F44|nr:hypothetical protein [Nocardia takedensis]